MFVLPRLFLGPVDDVVDKSDDNEESDSENDTDNEDAEKDQCTEVRQQIFFHCEAVLFSLTMLLFT